MTDKAKRRLFDLQTVEVSLVDKGAVRRPFLVMKNEGSTSSPIEELFSTKFKVNMSFLDLIKQTQFMGDDELEKFMNRVEKSEEIQDLLLGLTELEPEILKKSLGPLSKSENNIEDFMSVLKEEMPNEFMDRRVDNFETNINKLGNEALELSRVMVNMLNDFFNRGVKPGDSTFMPEETDMVEKSLTTEEISALPQNVQDHIKAMADENATLTASNTKVEKSLTTANEELATLKKNDPEADPFEGMSAVQKAMFTEKDDRLAKLEKAAEEGELKEFITKAEDFKLPEVKGSEFGPVLKEVHEKCSTETAEAVMKAFTSAADTIGKLHLTKGIGFDGEPGQTDAETELDSITKGIQKAENITYEAAMSKAVDQNPELYHKTLN